MAGEFEEMDHQSEDPETITIADSPPPARISIGGSPTSSSSSVEIVDVKQEVASPSRTDSSGFQTAAASLSPDHSSPVSEHGEGAPGSGVQEDGMFYDCENENPPLMNQIKEEVMDCDVDTKSQSAEAPNPKKKKRFSYWVQSNNPGGARDNQTRENCVYFKNQDAKITPSPVIQYMLDGDQPYDTVISCADGRIGAHRLVLATASPYIGSMFNSFSHRLGEVATLILPDVRYPILKVIMNFCYTGAMVFAKEDEEEVIAAMCFMQIGTYADITLREVITRPQPEEPIPSTSTQNQSPGSQSQFVQFPDHNLDAIAGPSSGFNSTIRRKKVVEILSSSSGTDDDNDSDESNLSDNENDEETDPTFKTGRIRSRIRKSSGNGNRDVEDDDDKKRINLPSSFLKNLTNGKVAEVDDDEAPYEYIITYTTNSKGKHCKLFQCYHCVGAFKTLENMSTHLENNHGIFLESRKADKEELRQILKCERCSGSHPHNQVAQTSACLAKRHRTRCYLCLESVKHTEFENHVKEKHAIRQKRGMFVVKCRWCDAGIFLQSPFDNKAISSHCYSQHLPSVDCDLSDDNLSGNEEHKRNSINSTQPQSLPQEQEPLQNGIDNDDFQDAEDEKSRRVSTGSTDSLFSPLHPQKQQSSLRLSGVSATSTPLAKPSTSKILHKKKGKDLPRPQPPSNTKGGDGDMRPVPTIIAMLQKASAKRKRELEEAAEQNKGNEEHENKDPEEGSDRKKRPRLETEKPKQKQTAKRTGAPVGHQRIVYPDRLQTGVPSYDSSNRKRGKHSNKSVDLDVRALPNVFVKIDYSKTLLADCLQLNDDDDGKENENNVDVQLQSTEITDNGNENSSASPTETEPKPSSSSNAPSENTLNDQSAENETEPMKVSESVIASESQKMGNEKEPDVISTERASSRIRKSENEEEPEPMVLRRSRRVSEKLTTPKKSNRVENEEESETLPESASKIRKVGKGDSKVIQGSASKQRKSENEEELKHISGTSSRRRQSESDEEPKGLRRSRRVSGKTNTPKKSNT